MLTENYLDTSQIYQKYYLNICLWSIAGRFDAKQQLPYVLPNKDAFCTNRPIHLAVYNHSSVAEGKLEYSLCGRPIAGQHPD